MKYTFALVIGEAIGLRCFKRMCNIEKYDHQICDK